MYKYTAYISKLTESWDKIENEKQRGSITLNTQQISHLAVAALKNEY